MTVVAAITSAANSAAVKADQHEDRRAKVTPEHEEEAAKLRVLWRDTAPAREKAGVGSQLLFGAAYNIGTQGAVGSFLNGKTPLSAKAARGFADGFGCKVRDFSPRLAAMLEPLETLVAQASESVAQHLGDGSVAQRLGVTPRALSLAKRFDALQDDEHRRLAYSALDNLLRSFERVEALPTPSPPTAPRAKRAPPRARSGAR